MLTKKYPSTTRIVGIVLRSYIPNSGDALKLSTATISYHMSVLTELKLVNTTVSANKIIYSLNRQKMEDTMTRLEDYFDHLEQQ